MTVVEIILSMIGKKGGQLGLGTVIYVYSFAYLGGGICLAGTSPTGQNYRSTDYGASWSLVQLEKSILHVCELKPTDNLNIDRQSMTVEFSGSGCDEEKELAADKKLIVLVIAA